MAALEKLLALILGPNRRDEWQLLGWYCDAESDVRQLLIVAESVTVAAK